MEKKKNPLEFRLEQEELSSLTFLFNIWEKTHEIKGQEAHEITGATSWSSLTLLQYQKLLYMFDLFFIKQLVWSLLLPVLLLLIAK